MTSSATNLFLSKGLRFQWGAGHVEATLNGIMQVLYIAVAFLNRTNC